MSETAVRTVTGIDLPTPGAWVGDPSHSSITFSVRHLMFAKVRGSFGSFDVDVTVDEVPEQSRVEARIDAASIDTGNGMRDDHLRSGDFLDVEAFPSLSFRSTGLERTGETTFRLPGELTIRDTTRPVTLEAELLGIGLDPYGNTKAAFSARGEIDREEFGITWNQALETGGMLLGRTITVELEIQLARS